jgi:hypothetical protein
MHRSKQKVKQHQLRKIQLKLTPDHEARALVHMAKQWEEILQARPLYANPLGHRIPATLKIQKKT